MSKFTTEVRFICEVNAGLSESADGSRVETIIANSREKIFDFDYPIFDEAYRSVLETKILKHFYTREIGLETVGLWKLKLNTKMNEIMPYYNQLYTSTLMEIDPLYTTKLTISHEGEAHDTSENTTINHSDGITSRGSMDKYSDTPQGSLQRLEDGTYLTNARKIDESGSAVNNSNGSGTGKADTFDHYINTISGYQNRDVSELLIKWRKTFLNIDMQIIDDLEELFMQLW